MKIITRAQLLEILLNLKGATFATLTLSTDPKMVQKDRVTKEANPYFGRVRKVARHNVCINSSYENSVNNQRVREGGQKDFVAQERAWGVHISPAIIEHKGNHYLHSKLEKTLDTLYVDDQGKEVDLAVLQPYLPKVYESKTQDLDKEVIVFSPSIENVIFANMLGEEFQVVG